MDKNLVDAYNLMVFVTDPGEIYTTYSKLIDEYFPSLIDKFHDGMCPFAEDGQKPGFIAHIKHRFLHLLAVVPHTIMGAILAIVEDDKGYLYIFGIEGLSFISGDSIEQKFYTYQDYIERNS